MPTEQKPFANDIQNHRVSVSFIVHREFGIIILVLISSCLLHLVVTAYFFFLEIFGDRVSDFPLQVALIEWTGERFSNL